MNPRVDYHARVPARLRPLSRFAGRWARRTQHAIRNAGATVHPRPVFVLGNQKSGTSAIAGMLAGASGRSVSIDMLIEIERPHFQQVHAGSLSFERYIEMNRWEFSHEIVKEPNLTLLHPWLVEAFPESPIVFVVRDPRDQIRSLLDNLAIPGDLADVTAAVRARLNPTWRLVLDGRWLGIAGDHYIEQLAGRWARCARVYLDQPETMRLCRYEAFQTDKQGEIRRLAVALGVPIVRDIDDLLDRPFQRPGDSGVDWSRFFGENLSRINAICGDEMGALGYD